MPSSIFIIRLGLTIGIVINHTAWVISDAMCYERGLHIRADEWNTCLTTRAVDGYHDIHSNYSKQLKFSNQFLILHDSPCTLIKSQITRDLVPAFVNKMRIPH